MRGAVEDFDQVNFDYRVNKNRCLSDVRLSHINRVGALKVS